MDARGGCQLAATPLGSGEAARPHPRVGEVARPPPRERVGGDRGQPPLLLFFFFFLISFNFFFNFII
jgi:hypothetical protein